MYYICKLQHIKTKEIIEHRVHINAAKVGTLVEFNAEIPGYWEVISCGGVIIY